jgi:tRNA A37 methylthiotransferase MiaB
MPNPVPPPVAQTRSEAFIALGRRLSLDFHRQFIGADVEVLFETAQRAGGITLWSGLTDNYLRISAPSEGDLANTLAIVHCLTADEAGLQGELRSILGACAYGAS